MHQTHFKGYPNLLSDTYLPNGCLIFLTENLNRGVEIGRGEEDFHVRFHMKTGSSNMQCNFGNGFWNLFGSHFPMEIFRQILQVINIFPIFAG